MDLLPFAGMLFSLLVVLIIAGSVLMFPVMRRLGRLLEVRIEQGRAETLPPEELQALRATIDGLRDEVARLSERQAFTERLLEEPRARMAPADGERGDRPRDREEA